MSTPFAVFGLIIVIIILVRDIIIAFKGSNKKLGRANRPKRRSFSRLPCQYKAVDQQRLSNY